MHNKYIAGILGIFFSGVLLVFLAGGIIGGIMVLSGTNNKFKPSHIKHVIKNRNFMKAGAISSMALGLFFMGFFGILTIE